MRNLAVVGTIAMALLELSGCTRPPERTGTTLTNSQLEDAITAQLRTEPALADVKVSVSGNQNEATLSGTVATQEQRQRALSIARNAHAGLSLTDKIDVKPREVARADYNEDMARETRRRGKDMGDNIGDSIEDAWLHTKVTAKLIGNSDTPARRINVDVLNKVVTLRGTVPDAAAKAEAERVASATEGVTRVVNKLNVGPA